MNPNKRVILKVRGSECGFPKNETFDFIGFDYLNFPYRNFIKEIIADFIEFTSCGNFAIVKKENGVIIKADIKDVRFIDERECDIELQRFEYGDCEANEIFWSSYGLRSVCGWDLCICEDYKQPGTHSHINEDFIAKTDEYGILTVYKVSEYGICYKIERGTGE